jgi:hypothetical protein
MAHGFILMMQQPTQLYYHMIADGHQMLSILDQLLLYIQHHFSGLMVTIIMSHSIVVSVALCIVLFSLNIDISVGASSGVDFCRKYF